jgi:phosphoserine aminotransferase
MNVTFTLPDKELTSEFLALCQSRGMINLKGYRTLGGVRASIYNGMPLEGVQLLAETMKEFEAKHK